MRERPAGEGAEPAYAGGDQPTPGDAPSWATTQPLPPWVTASQPGIDDQATPDASAPLPPAPDIPGIPPVIRPAPGAGLPADPPPAPTGDLPTRAWPVIGPRDAPAGDGPDFTPPSGGPVGPPAAGGSVKLGPAAAGPNGAGGLAQPFDHDDPPTGPDSSGPPGAPDGPAGPPAGPVRPEAASPWAQPPARPPAPGAETAVTDPGPWPGEAPPGPSPWPGEAAPPAEVAFPGPAAFAAEPGSPAEATFTGEADPPGPWPGEPSWHASPAQPDWAGPARPLPPVSRPDGPPPQVEGARFDGPEEPPHPGPYPPQPPTWTPPPGYGAAAGYPAPPGPAPTPGYPGAPAAGEYDDTPWVPDPSVPTAEEFAQRRAVRPADPVATMGVRAAVNKLGLVRLAPSRHEQDIKRDIEMVRRNFGGLRQVTVVNPKGGAGKTVAILLLAMTFGQKRGGYVLAWDNNETQGTLGMRAQQDFHSRTVRDLLRDLGQFQGAHGRIGDLSQYVRAQGEGMFDVLASDESATGGEMLTARAFGEIREVVSRFYKLIFVDTGNNVRAQNWQAAIDATDQLLITMSARNDSAETAARMLDHLEQSGRHRLVRQAVTVVSMPPSRKEIDLPAIERHFAARTRAVLLAPYERLIDTGEPMRYGQLTSATRDAWLKIAAAVAEGL
ncbi:chromosome partitioning protein [Plantactinospora siamensis]|uniref:Chromosome partitioning protein n=1 Tax=Plantactinospora siamensis TaxID=555372 RepID=A0ABV6NS84_9ACTN